MFYDLVLELTADLGEAFTDLDSDSTPGVIRYEYEYDDQNRRIILGKGTRPGIPKGFHHLLPIVIDLVF